jgi:hypothetical protein
MIFSNFSVRLHPSSFILMGAALACCAAPAYAIDEGVAQGNLVVDGRTIPLAHSYAHRLGSGDGLLDGRELRVLLTDRKVSHTLLAGIHPAQLYELARRGEIEGIMLTVHGLKPAAGLRGVLLVAGKNPRKPLTSFSPSGGDGGFKKLRIGNNRVLGEVRYQSLYGSPAFEYAATFSAPLFREDRGKRSLTHRAHHTEQQTSWQK